MPTKIPTKCLQKYLKNAYKMHAKLLEKYLQQCLQKCLPNAYKMLAKMSQKCVKMPTKMCAIIAHQTSHKNPFKMLAKVPVQMTSQGLKMPTNAIKML